MGGAAPLTACISADGSTLLFVRTEYLEYNEVAQTDGKSTYFCILVNEDSHIILFPYSLFCVLCLPRYQSPPPQLLSGLGLFVSSLSSGF